VLKAHSLENYNEKIAAFKFVKTTKFYMKIAPFIIKSNNLTPNQANPFIIISNTVIPDIMD
jgi:hypothetical protein